MAAFRTFPTFQGGLRDFEHWLRKIADSKLTDALRRERARKRGGAARFARNAASRLTSCSNLFDRIASLQRTPSREFHAAEAGHAVMIALNNLNDTRRTAIEMRYVAGLSLQDIALELDKTESAVNSLLFHARRELREVLGHAEKYFSDAGSSDQSQQADDA